MASEIKSWQVIDGKLATLESSLVNDGKKERDDLELDGGGAGGARGEAVGIGEELPVHKINQVVASQRLVVVEPAGLVLRRRPGLPPIRFVEDVAELVPFERGFSGFVRLKAVEVFEEEQPGRLLGVIELGGASRFLAQHVIDVFKRLFKHGYPGSDWQRRKVTPQLLRANWHNQ